MRYLLSMLLLSACLPVEPGTTGPPGPMGAMGAPGASDVASGSRIQVRHMTTPDGLKMGWDLYDSQRQESCSFQKPDLSKPDWYCLPAFAVIGIWYLDAGCQDRITPDNRTGEAYGLLSRSPFAIAPLTLVGPRQELYQSVAGECSKLTGNFAAVYRLGASIGLDAFVAGTIR